MNKKATPAEVAESTASAVDQSAAIAAHLQTRELATALLRIALDLSTLGHVKASREVQAGALRLARVKPGQSA